MHGFPSLRHYEVHDLTANLLPELCNFIEPHLQPLRETLQYKTASFDDNTWQLMAFGEDSLKGHNLIDVRISTLLYLQINPYILRTEVMIEKRDINTNKGFMK